MRAVDMRSEGKRAWQSMLKVMSLREEGEGRVEE